MLFVFALAVYLLTAALRDLTATGDVDRNVGIAIVLISDEARFTFAHFLNCISVALPAAMAVLHPAISIPSRSRGVFSGIRKRFHDPLLDLLVAAAISQHLFGDLVAVTAIYHIRRLWMAVNRYDRAIVTSAVRDSKRHSHRG